MSAAVRGNFARFGVCILLLTLFAPVSRPDTLVMPRELVDFAHAKGCTPIDNFFERPGMVNPPFVYGWLPGSDEDSAVFWCKKAEKTDKPYNLMLTVRDLKNHELKVPDQKQLAGCPAVIEYWNGPAGLSIETQGNLDLRYFRNVTEPRPRSGGPTNVVPNARVIASSYDGVRSLFFCYKGHWLINIQD
ncbi:MAG: hypothetical protein WCA19_06030 [Candidatus Acidiferrales bacterium]